MIDNINKPAGLKKTPQIKICGLTRVNEAIQCAEQGADAIGLVFYSRSPRNITSAIAREISLALPKRIMKIGVFVNETYAGIMEKVESCKLNGAQLHGNESPQLVESLLKENLIVIKALFAEKKPFLNEAAKYHPSAYLAECGSGDLPGGNALEWNWKKARRFGEQYPLILAGGLSPENISRAIYESMPDAVDISSGVESQPGKKDLHKVKSFISAVLNCNIDKNFKSIF